VRKIKIPHLLEFFEKKRRKSAGKRKYIYQKEKTCIIVGKRKSGDGG